MTDNTVHIKNGLTLDLSENRQRQICGSIAGIFYGEPVFCQVAGEAVPVIEQSRGLQARNVRQFARA
tara:strand:+ start:2598 stop:2798 length:201 start_codon:yes stop_codon:yes gene_type:complete